MTTGPDVTAAFCATLADEWVRGGVTDVVVCPGSRSTPLALAVAAEPGLRVHVHHDERSGGFLAVGLGLASGRPAVVVTTSGTAAANLHPAVVEAHQARVPLIVATADRPPELQGVGAPQTIDQTHLFGRAVRRFDAPGVPDDDSADGWRSFAARSVVDALGPPPGPVHLNLAFREPLVGTAGPLPDGRADGRPWMVGIATAPAQAAVSDAASGALLATRGVLVAGEGCATSAAVHRLAVELGWPVLADPRSGARTPVATTVAAADAILRHEATARRLRPEVVIRLGEPPASKVVNRWLDGSDAEQVLVVPPGARVDPGHRASVVIEAPVGPLCHVLAHTYRHDDERDPDRPVAWLAAWVAAEDAAQAAIDAVLAGHAEPTEPATAREVLAHLPDGTTLVTSSSMPIRDLEWYGAAREGVRVVANRGANGIDGVTSTAVGVALETGGPTVLLIGDVAFLHDTNGLLGLAARPVDLTIVVVDNDGGGIFSFLPQASSLPAERFERLFGTPHGVDVAALAAVHGLAVTSPGTAAEVGPAVAACVAAGGPQVVHVRTDRAANVGVHDEIHEAVAAALDLLA